MTCQKCGRPAENGTPTHHMGCPENMITSTPGFGRGADEATVELTDICERDGCTNRKKEWSGRGARPKYCADGHK